MKKRLVIAMVTGLMLVSLAGCGTQADATSQSPESSSAVESKAETEPSVAEESIGSEKTGGEEEGASGFTGAENDSIVLYAERGSNDYVPLRESEYEAHPGTVNTTTDIPLYDGDGYNVGYIKSGSNVAVTEYGQIAWTRFENPITEAEYDYLYVMRDYVIDGNLGVLTTTELENLIKESLGNRNYDVPVFTETTEDMELYEFRIPMYYDSETDISIYKLYEYYDRDKNEVQIMDYKTYSVVCTKDTDDYIVCQIYYKDLITEDEFNFYGQ